MRIAILGIAILSAGTAVAQYRPLSTPQYNVVVVEGNVVNPGTYWVSPLERATLSGILTKAGGLKVQAPYPKAVIRRLDNQGKRIMIQAPRSIGGRYPQDVKIHQGDVVIFQTPGEPALGQPTPVEPTRERIPLRENPPHIDTPQPGSRQPA